MIELIEMAENYNTLITEKLWYTHEFHATDNREVSEAIRRCDMGDARGGRRTRGRRNPVKEDLHRETSGNRGALGGAMSLI